MREVVLIFGEVVDVALERIAAKPARSTLPAPIEHRHGKAPAAKLANRLEIFLDELGAARERCTPCRADSRSDDCQLAIAQAKPLRTSMKPIDAPSGIGFLGVATRSMKLEQTLRLGHARDDDARSL